jgi:NAD(P)H-hydrate repair Nnr-like enzyme with NAD(P)H-hydrate dehydratase domain
MPADVIAVGPGLGQGPAPRRFVQASSSGPGVPLVLDADALNAFAGEPDRPAGRDGLDVIVTPHPGEMARLAHATIEQVQEATARVAREFATAHHVHVVLKGHRTVVATRRDGRHQPHRQPRHGDRRHGRRAHRHDRRLVRAVARRRGRLQARGLPARARPAISPRPTRGRTR